jgi:SAM-dependent methyltransferase
MHENDKRKILERYGERIEKVGHGASAIGEPKQRQAFYFDFLTQVPGLSERDSVLDIGCGYGDLYDFLKLKGWAGNYVGIDINPALISEGRRRYPGTDLRVQDIQENEIGVVTDWCICCHALTSDTEGAPFLQHFESMLNIMWKSCRKGLIFNMLSPLADFTNKVHARPPVSDVLSIVSRLTHRFTLRHDYMPFEYAIYAFKASAINRERLIFSAHDQHFDEVTSDWARGNRIHRKEGF